MSYNAQVNPARPRRSLQNQSGPRSPKGSQNLGTTQQRVWHSCPANYRPQRRPGGRQTLDGIPSLFEPGTPKAGLTSEQREQLEAPLFQQIGQLKVENDYLKKKLRTS
jgi:hypothetical protein